MSFWDTLLDALGLGRSSPASISRPHPAAATAARDDRAADQRCGDDPQAWWRVGDGALIAPTPPTRPELSPEARGLENLLVSHFDGRDLSLPTMPQGPDRVLRELRRGDLLEAAGIIGEDPVLAAAVLRAVNSPFYRAEQEITAVRTAVTRLGSRALRTLMMHQALQTATLQSKGCDPKRAGRLWERARAGAWIMQALAELTGVDEEEAFLVGLLHDIGSVVVLRITSAERAKSKTVISDAEFEFLCFECHQEFGELIAEAWKLPDRLKALIRDHHTPPEPAEPLARERWALMLCDMIAAVMNITPYQPFDLMRCHPAVALELGQRPEFAAFLNGLPAFLDDALSVL